MYQVTVELQGLLAHACSLAAAQLVLSPACSNLQPTPATVARSDLHRFTVQAWCIHSDLIAKEKILFIPEPEPVHGREPPLFVDLEEVIYNSKPMLRYRVVIKILEIISSKDCSEEEIASVVDKFRSMLTDYFNNKKSRLKLGFVKEVVQRNPWIGRELFGFVLQEIGGAQAEYRRTQTLELLDCILKSWVGYVAGAYALVEYLAQLCGLIQEVLSNIPENELRRKEVRKFTRVSCKLCQGFI
jgi:hypothetical protein